MASRLKFLTCLFGAVLLSLAMNADAACTSTVVNSVKVQDQFSFPTPTFTSPYWSATTTYTEGQIVQRDGFQYQARWWNYGNIPLSDSGEVWKATIGFNGKPQAWQAGQVYYN